MAKMVLIVRGPVGASVGSDMIIASNPQPHTVTNKQDMPSSLNPDDMLITPPGSRETISLKAFKERKGI